MTVPGLLSLPTQPGGYRWYYADFSAGPLHAVVILLVGSIFSPRYSEASQRGATATSHCAVNFALYDGTARRAWVLSEYGGCEASASALRIGRSRAEWHDGGVRFELDERTAPWGRPVQATLALQAETPLGEELQLCPGEPHHWQPLMPRARARLEVPGMGLALEGLGYHDTNHGSERLGGGVPGWQWERAHEEEATRVRYRLPGGDQLNVRAGGFGVSVQRVARDDVSQVRTRWGLSVPASARAGLVESSPFYARFVSHAAGGDVVGEAADFRRFHSPFIRWMAHFRTRTGARA